MAACVTTAAVWRHPIKLDFKVAHHLPCSLSQALGSDLDFEGQQGYMSHVALLPCHAGFCTADFASQSCDAHPQQGLFAAGNCWCMALTPCSRSPADSVCLVKVLLGSMQGWHTMLHQGPDCMQLWGRLASVCGQQPRELCVCFRGLCVCAAWVLLGGWDVCGCVVPWGLCCVLRAACCACMHVHTA